MHFILSGPHTYLHLCNHINYKKLQYNFPKRRGGAGIEGRFEFFRKFIRFGGLTLPLVKKEQKTFSMPKGCLLLVIEPVHRGSSSILLKPFFGTPCGVRDAAHSLINVLCDPSFR